MPPCSAVCNTVLLSWPNAVDLEILVSDDLPHCVGIIVVDRLSHLVKQSLVPFLAAKESCQFDKCFSAPNSPDTK